MYGSTIKNKIHNVRRSNFSNSAGAGRTPPSRWLNLVVEEFKILHKRRGGGRCSGWNGKVSSHIHK